MKQKTLRGALACLLALAALAVVAVLVFSRGPGLVTGDPPTADTGAVSSTENIVLPPTTPPTTPQPTTATRSITLPPLEDTTKPTRNEQLAKQKLIALTFDDGPHPQLTPQLLNYLKQQQVHVTFFVVGKFAVSLPKTIARAAREGHQVASHTYNHKYLTKLDAAGRRKEIDKAAEAIKSAAGSAPTAVRPPYGAVNDAVCADIKVPVLLWSVDPRDWESLDAAKITAHVLKNAKDGDIILMHDYYESTIEAVKRVVPVLKERGFTFVTVDQLLEARGGAKPGEIVRSRPPKK